MTTPRRRLVLAIACLSVALCSAPTGAQAQTPAELAAQPADQVFAEMVSTLRDVRSYHLSATFEAADVRSTMTVDFVSLRKIRFSMEVDDVIVRYLIVGSGNYTKGNRAYWRAGGAPTRHARRLADRWLIMERSAETRAARKGLQELAPATLAYCMAKGHGTLTNLGLRTYGGRPVVVLRDQGENPGGAPAEYYVAAEGPRYVRRMVQTGAGTPGKIGDPRCDGEGESLDEDDPTSGIGSEMRFSAFDKPAEIRTPRQRYDVDDLLD